MFKINPTAGILPVSPFLLARYVCLTFCLLVSPFSLLHAQENELPAPVLNGNAGEETATAGYFTLQWALPPDSGGAVIFEVQESQHPSHSPSRLVYSGPDLATTLSGKSDGIYFYRVRARSSADSSASPWSNIHQVEVVHHPLRRAFFFLGLGAIVFLATMVTILRGHNEEKSSAMNDRSNT